MVTLIEEPGAICWGRAYRLEPGLEDKVLAQLDHREQGGYERQQLPLYFSTVESVTGTMYHATPENVNYLGAANIPHIAQQVLNAHGPSGPNIEYVLKLEISLLELGAEDEHITELAKALKQLVASMARSYTPTDP